MSNPSRNHLTKGWRPHDPTRHSKLKELHPDMSSGAARIYAASVALTEVMHLAYIVEEMGGSMPLPYDLYGLMIRRP